MSIPLLDLTIPSLALPLLWGIATYFLGSVLWALVIARLYGVDIRAVGTRNPGTANVVRNVGIVPGILVLLADGLTGVAAIVPTYWIPHPEVGQPAAAAGVVLGTIFPVFSRFRGGSGLAKILGVSIALSPIGFALLIPVGIVAAVFLRHSALSGGSVLAGAGFYALLVSADYIAAAIIATISLVVLIRDRFFSPGRLAARVSYSRRGSSR